MSKIKRTGKIKLKPQFGNKPLRKSRKIKKRKFSKGIDGYYLNNGKITVLKKDWVFGI